MQWKESNTILKCLLMKWRLRFSSKVQIRKSWLWMCPFLFSLFESRFIINKEVPRLIRIWSSWEEEATVKFMRPKFLTNKIVLPSKAICWGKKIKNYRNSELFYGIFVWANSCVPSGWAQKYKNCLDLTSLTTKIMQSLWWKNVVILRRKKISRLWNMI